MSVSINEKLPIKMLKKQIFIMKATERSRFDARYRFAKNDERTFILIHSIEKGRN